MRLIIVIAFVMLGGLSVFATQTTADYMPSPGSLVVRNNLSLEGDVCVGTVEIVYGLRAVDPAGGVGFDVSPDCALNLRRFVSATPEPLGTTGPIVVTSGDIGSACSWLQGSFMRYIVGSQETAGTSGPDDGVCGPNFRKPVWYSNDDGAWIYSSWGPKRYGNLDYYYNRAVGILGNGAPDCRTNVWIEPIRTSYPWESPCTWTSPQDTLQDAGLMGVTVSPGGQIVRDMTWT